MSSIRAYGRSLRVLPKVGGKPLGERLVYFLERAAKHVLTKVLSLGAAGIDRKAAKACEQMLSFRRRSGRAWCTFLCKSVR